MTNFEKVNLKFSKSSPELKFPFAEGEGLATTDFQKPTSNVLRPVLS